MKNQKRILAISDIHGNGHLLTKLLQATNYSPTIDRLIMLGDYINKGPNSIGTLQTIHALREEGAVALAGNNELKWLNSEDRDVEDWRPFLKSLPFLKEIGPFVFVHAGLKKGVPLHEQQMEDLTGIHTPSIESFPEKIVVFGHTPTFRLRSDVGRVWLSKGMIGIDTGAGHGYHLSLVDVTNWIAYAVSTHDSKQVEAYSLQKQIVFGHDQE